MEDNDLSKLNRTQGPKHASGEHLVVYMKVLLQHVDDLVTATAEHTDEDIAIARERVRASLRAAKEQISEGSSKGGERAKVAARASAEYARMHPWQLAGVAVGMGFTLGYLTRALKAAQAGSRRWR